jgi:hypothetical protein
MDARYIFLHLAEAEQRAFDDAVLVIRELDRHQDLAGLRQVDTGKNVVFEKLAIARRQVGVHREPNGVQKIALAGVVLADNARDARSKANVKMFEIAEVANDQTRYVHNYCLGPAK